MSNELKIFENNEFGQVRVVMKDGEPWFVAADVCKALGLTQVSIAIGKLDDDECRLIEIPHPQSHCKALTVNGVTEPGLYSLVIGSRKPSARQFKRWITHEVIPSIRKNGAYIAGQDQMTDAELVAKALVAANNIIAEREKRIMAMTQKIAEMQPKANYYDIVMSAPQTVLVRQIAEDYGMSAQKLNSLLNQFGIQYKQNNQWLLYAPYKGKGYTRSQTYAKDDGFRHFASEHTRWTQKGRVFIYNVLKKYGILPICERMSNESQKT